jgi:hypothetical protein
MHTPEEAALALEMADRLIELYTRRDEACQYVELTPLNRTRDELGKDVLAG